LVISFRNGLYFVFFNQFVPYAAVNKDDYPNLATRYIDAWFHNDILYRGLFGAPDASPLKATWREEARYKNIEKLLRCTKCKCHQHQHNDTRCSDPEFEEVCDDCGCDELECECTDEDGNPFFNCYRVNIRKGLRSIPTPFFDGILDHQLGAKPDYVDVYYWVWAMLGRWLFPLGREWDSWEKLVCLFGNAGTGKSCLLHILKYFVPPESATILSMNSQETFGTLLPTALPCLALPCLSHSSSSLPCLLPSPQAWRRFSGLKMSISGPWSWSAPVNSAFRPSRCRAW